MPAGSSGLATPFRTGTWSSTTLTCLCFQITRVVALAPGSCGGLWRGIRDFTSTCLSLMDARWIFIASADLSAPAKPSRCGFMQVMIIDVNDGRTNDPLFRILGCAGAVSLGD